MTAKEHYDTHLGDVYSWMMGDFFEKMSGQTDFFLKNGIRPSGNHVAHDLGAGNGIQSVALAKIGFKVNAVDFNKRLLEDLNANKGNLAITTFQNDIYNFLNTTSRIAELVVCMGDTLTHFPNYDEVKKVVHKMSLILAKNGKVAFSYRDLSEEQKGTERFFHIKSDDYRSMTCFLEYFPEHVMIYDVMIEKRDEGWIQKVSCYPKIRIPVSKFKKTLLENGITVVHEEMIRGMTFLTGQKN